MFSQCNVSYHGVAVTQSSEHHNFRTYLEILLTCSTDAGASHFRNTYCYLHSGDMEPSDQLVENHTATTNEGSIAIWISLIGIRDIQLFGRLHNVRCKVRLLLLPGVRLHIKLTKAQPSSHLVNKIAD